MAIEVEASKDIREYKVSNIGPFDTRQVVCIGLSLLYSIPIAKMLPVSTDNKVIIGLLLALPVAACGFVKLDGCYFEVLVLRLLYLYILTPLRRKTVIENTYKKEIREMRLKEEEIKLSSMKKSQRKRYLKQKKKPVITYSRKYKVYR